MVIAQWSDELATGMTKVDDQHKELIRMVNEFHDALSKGKGKEAVGKTINFLSDYVVDHFKNEEKLMLDHNFPGYVIHKSQHEQFLKEFSDLVKEVNAATATSFLAIRVQRAVVQWLINHIMNVDKQMAKFIIAKTGGNAA